MADKQTNSQWNVTQVVLAAIGLVAIALLFALICAGIGAYAYHVYAPQVIPQPHPDWPQPTPQPYEPHAWYRPSDYVLRQLVVPRDCFNRSGQIWRWEVNEIGEYRYRRVKRCGTCEDETIGQGPLQPQPESFGDQPEPESEATK